MDKNTHPPLTDQQIYDNIEDMIGRIAQRTEVISRELPIVIEGLSSAALIALSEPAVRDKLVTTAAVFTNAFGNVVKAYADGALSIKKEIESYDDLSTSFALAHPIKAAQIAKDMKNVKESWKVITDLFSKKPVKEYEEESLTVDDLNKQ